MANSNKKQSSPKTTAKKRKAMDAKNEVQRAGMVQEQVAMQTGYMEKVQDTAEKEPVPAPAAPAPATVNTPEPAEPVAPEQVEPVEPVAEDDKPSALKAAQEDREMLKTIHRQKYYRLIINAGRSEQDTAPVFLAINGVSYLIVRNKECVVPEAVIECLNNAVEMQAVSREVDGQIVTETVMTKRFSYSVLGEAPSPHAKVA